MTLGAILLGMSILLAGILVLLVILLVSISLQSGRSSRTRVRHDVHKIKKQIEEEYD